MDKAIEQWLANIKATQQTKVTVTNTLKSK